MRVAGDLMIVNHERNLTPIGRRAEQMPGVRRELRDALGREPTRAELAQKLSVTEADIVEIEAAEKQPYRNGGFRIYDVSDPAKPKLIHHQMTGGIGVHRFDMDERYAYISTEMDGFIGNILVIYDMRDPKRPQEVSRWWMPGQHIAGGEKPTWSGQAAPAAPRAALRRRDVGELLARRLPHRRRGRPRASRRRWRRTTTIRRFRSRPTR